MPPSCRMHAGTARPSFRGVVVATVASLAAAAPARAQAAPRPEPLDTAVVSTAWLAARLSDPRVVVVEVTEHDSARAVTIPGSRAIAYRRLVVSRDSVSHELPPIDSIRSLAEGLGISSDSRVVVYAAHAPMATRLLLTLDALGLVRLSYLDGGLPAWQAEGRQVSPGEPAVTRGTIRIPPRPEVVVTAAWVEARLGRPGLSLIDTRTDGEYRGADNQSGMPSAGHLQGARQLEWQSLFDAETGLRLKPWAELRRMFEERVGSGDTVVTYCWVGYRGSATYFVARALGLDARLYDGSYQDWRRRQLPVTAGVAP